MERSVSRTFINAENIQPLLHQFLLAIRNGLINANRIKIARKNHITHGSADPVIQMQTTADVTDMLLISQMVSPLPRRRPKSVKSLL